METRAQRGWLSVGQDGRIAALGAGETSPEALAAEEVVLDALGPEYVRGSVPAALAADLAW